MMSRNEFAVGADIPESRISADLRAVADAVRVALNDGGFGRTENSGVGVSVKQLTQDARVVSLYGDVPRERYETFMSTMANFRPAIEAGKLFFRVAIPDNAGMPVVIWDGVTFA